MIRWVKQKTNIEAEARPSSEYQLYIRYDERSKQPVQRIVEKHVKFDELLNQQTFDDERDLKQGSIYIFNDLLVRYLYPLPEIKVLVFDIVIIPTNIKEPPKFGTISNNQDYAMNINTTESKEKEVPAAADILSKNLNQGEINV